jgi:alpha-tubulin suppressor-like RCC1 family protein
MSAKSVLTVCGVAAVSFVLVGCGASGAASRTTTTRGVSAITRTGARRRRGSVVYQWGRAGGGLINPGRPFGWGGPPHAHFVAVGHDRHVFGSHPGSVLGVGPTRVVPTVVGGIPGAVVQVATSNSTGYALTASGDVYAWGTGSQGELGNGTYARMATTAVRVHFPAAVRIARLPDPMPYNGGMAIDRSGNAWAWGNDEGREFCQPRGGDVDTPIRIPLSHVTLAAGAWRHAIYDAGGRVVSCGLSDHGQLGDGTSGPRADTGTPVAVQGLPTGRVRALTSAFGNAGALMADGAYYDWGINSSGQVGDGTTVGRATAVRVALPGPVRSVFGGGSFADNGQTMALLRDGQVWVWGANASGQLGDGTTRDSARPIRLRQPVDRHIVAVGSGGASDYAIGRSGALWAWGQNAQGELGDGFSGAMATRPVGDSVRIRQVSATARNVAALAVARP